MRHRATAPRPRHRTGISLVEICIAFAVLGLSMLPILSMFSSAGRQAGQTSDFGTAIALQKSALQVNLLIGEGDQETALLTTIRLRNVAATEEIW